MNADERKIWMLNNHFVTKKVCECVIFKTLVVVCYTIYAHSTNYCCIILETFDLNDGRNGRII